MTDAIDDRQTWRELAQQFRVDSIRVSSEAGSGHPTSSHVGRRADVRARQQVLSLSRRRAEVGQQRPPDLLEGPRLAAVLLDPACDRRDRRTGDGDVPPQGQPARRPPDARPAVRRRRDRVARPGPAGRSRHRARRQAARSARLPDLGPVRRQRDGRGLDLGGARPGQLRQASTT